MSSKMITTYSMWSKFRNCRKACEWRYLKELVPVERDPALAFGSVIHASLELWHRHQDLHRVLEHIHRVYSDRSGNEKQRADWHLATAMMKGYASRYPREDFEIFALELPFEGPIINPVTGAASRSFSLAGKVDGIVKMNGQYFLLEHKTASLIDSGYLERLWGDFQIQLYCWYIEQAFGWRISGIIYNILAKAKLHQRLGETEAEYRSRCEDLIAKSKSGKTSAQRKMPESDEEYQARLADWYAHPDAFHREMLFVSRDQFQTLRTELWELARSFLDARQRGIFYQNTNMCFTYGHPCAYFPLCRSEGNPNVIETLYRHEPPHTELVSDPTEQPIF